MTFGIIVQSYANECSEERVQIADKVVHSLLVERLTGHGPYQEILFYFDFIDLKCP